MSFSVGWVRRCDREARCHRTLLSGSPARSETSPLLQGLSMQSVCPLSRPRGWTIRRRGCWVGRAAAIGGAGTVGSMRIATWNVNSVKQRLPRLLPWLDERRPDVVCLQETKLADDAFAELLNDELATRGYVSAAHGEATWNGVAILSRVGLEDVVRGIPGSPGFPRPEARAVAATCGGIRVLSVYVPNGRVPGSDHYKYKLAWLAALREAVAADPDGTIVCGG